MENKVLTDILPCGIGFTFKRSFSDVAYCSLTLRSGTRDEKKPGSGTAHFTEHLLFKGTETRSASAINNCIERSGGDLNAFTTKEETVIHASILKEELTKGISLLLELAFRSLFRENDIETEKNVIIDEILSYKDSPPDAIYDHFEELLLEGTALAPQILGSMKSVRNMKRADITEYVGENFTYPRAVLSVVADMDEREIRKAVSKAVAKSGIPPIGASPAFSQAYPMSSGLREGKVFEKTLNKRNHQANCIIGCTGYPMGAEKERIALVLLCNILGGPAANSVMNTELREKKGWVYGVDASYTPYADNGVVAISFGCDREKIEKCCNAVTGILEKFREKRVSDTFLKNAKKQLKGQLLVSADNGEQKCITLGKNYLLFGKDADDTKGQKILDTITADDIIDCARTVFSPERLSKLIYI